MGYESMTQAADTGSYFVSCLAAPLAGASSDTQLPEIFTLLKEQRSSHRTGGPRSSEVRINLATRGTGWRSAIAIASNPRAPIAGWIAAVFNGKCNVKQIRHVDSSCGVAGMGAGDPGTWWAASHRVSWRS